MSLQERIVKFIEFKGLSVQSFERQCGLSNGSVSKMTDNTRFRTLEKISNVYPDLNISWLRTGEGDMLHEAESTGSQNTKDHHIGHTGVGKAADEVTVEKLMDELKAQRESYERIIMALINEKKE